MIIKSEIIMLMKNGTVAFAIVIIGNPDTPEPTNKFTPRGGVINPIARLTTMIIPKCIGSYPRLIATGNNSGVKIIIAATVSIKQPTINNKRLINRIITIGLSEIDNNPSVI